MNVRVSAAVSPCNRADMLRRCIDSLLAQDYDGQSAT
jgi:hypothetical protein